MVRIGGDPVSEELGVDPRAARAGVLQLLENEDRGALAHHEAVARPVERPRGPAGVVVAARQRSHRAEPGHRARADLLAVMRREHADGDLLHQFPNAIAVAAGHRNLRWS